MTTTEQLNTCRKCIHQQRDEHAQILCSYTNKKPDFQEQCSLFKVDPDLANEGIFDEFETEIYLESAGNGKRFLNYLADSIFIITVVSSIEYFINLNRNNILGEYKIFELVINLLLTTMIYTLLEYLTKGRSIGKLLTNTKVITTDGDMPNFTTCLKRSLCRLIPFESFSFFGSTDGAWHDSIPNTRVVIIPKNE